MALTKATVPTTIKMIARDYNSGKLNTRLSIQRSTVWDEERSSLLIHSVLTGYPVPPIYVQIRPDDPNKTTWVLDGKQRITTFAKYLNDEFALDESTPDVNGVEIAGKKFTELSEDLQDELKSENLVVYRFDDLQEEERDEMFRRLNNGMALTKMELTRVIASGNVMDFVQELTSKQFFAVSAAITDSARNRMVDEELVLQIIYLIHSNNPVGLSGKDLREFAEQMKAEGGIPEHQKAMMRKVTDYLSEVFPVREKFLKKIHVPMLFLTAIKAVERNIPAVKFGGWAQDFFKRFDMTKHNPYSSAARSGSAKKENVTKRIEIMTDDFDGHIDTAPDYIAPVDKSFGRGRKKTDNSDNSQESGDQEEEQPAL
jgi:hypothetical protein